jgi:hypothetical protein
MRIRTLLTVALPFLFGFSAACSGDAYVRSTDTINTEGAGFEGASLIVHSPASASINYTEFGLELSAEVLNADGEPIEFEDITWTFARDEDPAFVGLESVLDLDYGIYDLTVTADLPGGSRLQTNLSSIRMQGERTGIYAGNLLMAADMDFQGTAFTATCLGGMTFVVGMDGETLHGDGGCSMILVIIDPIDVAYALGGEVDGADASGAIGLDLAGFFEIPVDWEGSFEGEDFSAGFAGSAILFEFEGSIDATRISEYVDEPEVDDGGGAVDE